MRCLVTGGAGFIGSHLCESLVQDAVEVVCLDNFNTYYDPQIKRHNLAGLSNHQNFNLVEADIRDSEALHQIFREYKFDIIVHLAARAGVRPSIQDPQLYQQVNVGGTLNLLEMARGYQIPKFILASTSSIYGNNRKVPFSESDFVDHPISPYAATKKACELLAHTYSALHGISITCLRFFTVYGPRQRPDMAIHKFAKLMADGQPIPLFGDGKSRRDYTYYSDIIQGVRKAMDRCEGYHVYNLGESQTIELLALVRLIEEHMGITADIQWLPDQPGDVRETFADISLAQKDLGYAPTTSIQEGIPKFVEWFNQYYK